MAEDLKHRRGVSRGGNRNVGGIEANLGAQLVKPPHDCRALLHRALENTGVMRPRLDYGRVEHDPRTQVIVPGELLHEQLAGAGRCLPVDQAGAVSGRGGPNAIEIVAFSAAETGMLGRQALHDFFNRRRTLDRRVNRYLTRRMKPREPLDKAEGELGSQPENLVLKSSSSGESSL